MRRYLLVALLVGILACLSPVLKAQDVSELKKEIEKQYEVLLKMQTRLMEIEARQNKQDKAIEEVKTSIPEKGHLAESLEWVENLRIYGGLRYRHESLDDDSASSKRNRNRIRARIGLEADINDEWTAGVRIASGSSDSPTSTNQTLGDSGSDGFSSKELWLDLAYLGWERDNLAATFGKMKMPFYNVGKNQLIWDGDLNPEGIAGSYSFDVSDSITGKLTGAGFWLSERGSAEDTSLWGIQAMLKQKIDEDSQLIGGVTYYDYGNIQGQTIAGISANGNTRPGGVYTYDYNLVEGFLEYGTKVGGMPVSAYGNYVVNTASNVKEDTAWLIGAKLGKCKAPGSWDVGYEYRDLEADAVLGGVNDSDFLLGGTAGKGHKIGFGYQLAENTKLGLAYLMCDRDKGNNNGDDVDVIQVDLSVKF